MTPEHLEHIADLTVMELKGVLDATARAGLEDWKREHPEQAAHIHHLLQSGRLQKELEALDTADVGIRARLMKAGVPVSSWQAPVHRLPSLHHWWVAASVIFMLATGAYLWLQQSQPLPLTSDIRHSPTDIEPGKEGAVLTLSDGTQVVLDSLGNGVIATQNGSDLVLKDGQLAYDPTEKTKEAVVYNTMSTPKGRQFNLRLPDGTMVWLNAASSLRYPTQFSGADRRVSITGEAYFEVAPNAKQPFFVKIDDQAEVEVLGTKFNVNAYEDEASMNTTLIEGSVKISLAQPSPDDAALSLSQVAGSSGPVILKPGQQAQLINALSGLHTQPEVKLIKDADIDKVMAWKNGTFNFQGARLEEVMRQLSRWYDITVVYEKGIPDIHFVGELSRDLNLTGLLSILKTSEVNFRIEEGRRLVVMP